MLEMDILNSEAHETKIAERQEMQEVQDTRRSQRVQASTIAIRPTSLDLQPIAELLSPVSPVNKQVRLDLFFNHLFLRGQLRTRTPFCFQILPLSFSSDEEVVNVISFPLGPPTSVEPPKEKPPPPPVEVSDEENQPIEPLKRLNSTRRIKKELRTRRSDFLGIEGVSRYLKKAK